VKKQLRHLTLAIATGSACVAVAACGSSSPAATTSSRSAATTATTSTTSTAPAGATAFAARRAKLDACLKAHGVKIPARPPGASRPNGGYPGYGGGRPYSGGFRPYGGAGGGVPGGRFFGNANSKTAKAFQACASQIGFAQGQFRRARVRYTKATLDSFTACVKKHGYTLPKPNTSGTGPVFPARIQGNKQFQAAAKNCVGILRPVTSAGARPGATSPGSGPPPAATATTSSA